MGIEVPGERRRGRPKRRWLDSIRNDLSERGLSEEDEQDRPHKTHRPHIKVGKEEVLQTGERENFIEINRKHDDTCTNKNYNEGLCGLIQGDLR